MIADGILAQANWQIAGFGIYIHWPYCAAKCPYCDFNSHVSSQIDHEEWAEAYERALEYAAHETGNRVVRSVFFGGGTPSLMASATLGRVLDKIAEKWSLANDVEITLEANPSSVEGQKFNAFRLAGVNRVSLGIQALNDPDLKRLGRLHSTAEALTALETARNTFDRFSFDLIYARQDQSEEAWAEELVRALSFQTDHLSLYQLTIEPGTAFHARQSIGKLQGLPTDDRAVRLFEITQELTDAAGLSSYEVSNHARPGAESRHNLIYWRGGDWLGIGPGAHGRVSRQGRRQGTIAFRDPKKWLQDVGRNRTGLESTEVIPQDEQATEYLMMSLRLSEGTDLARLASLGLVLDEARLGPLIDQGMLKRDASHLSCTPDGRLLLNSVLLELLRD
ncbi:MAG: radical SAM family heme chaperone HemW [Pseudomonadota bacterium]